MYENQNPTLPIVMNKFRFDLTLALMLDCDCIWVTLNRHLSANSKQFIL
ncbi:MAG: hypothetical protein H6Q54_211 [Deltaproteobacteria bacterium]|jgi:hypothetical protein|nr:hypothetical protein [Deltaproteobacteria bacterium]